jgi:Reverse transcriptase (RNA-dependent DNA polymerase)
MARAGVLSYRQEGTPQGGVVSPILSNIYLHEVLDTWFDEEVKVRLKGRAFLVRYADDCVMGFEYEEDARRVYAVLPKRFEKYGLRLVQVEFPAIPQRSLSFHEFLRAQLIIDLDVTMLIDRQFTRFPPDS